MRPRKGADPKVQKSNKVHMRTHRRSGLLLMSMQKYTKKTK